MCCIQLISKVCVEQHLEAIVYVCDDADTYQISSYYSRAMVCHFDCV